MLGIFFLIGKILFGKWPSFLDTCSLSRVLKYLTFSWLFWINLPSAQLAIEQQVLPPPKCYGSSRNWTENWEHSLLCLPLDHQHHGQTSSNFAKDKAKCKNSWTSCMTGERQKGLQIGTIFCIITTKRTLEPNVLFCKRGLNENCSHQPTPGPGSPWPLIVSLSCKFGYLWSFDCLWSCKITEHWNLFWFFWCSSFLQVWRSHFIFCVRKKKQLFRFFHYFQILHSMVRKLGWKNSVSQCCKQMFNIFSFTILQILVSLVCYPSRAS